MASKFHCTNPSDSWIVAIDDVYMEVPSREAAMYLYDMVGEIENSPFGSAAVLPPGHGVVSIFREVATESIQSFSRRVNADYVVKHMGRARARQGERGMVPLHERMREASQFGLFSLPRG